MNGKAMQGNFQATDQAGQVILFNQARETSAHPTPFLDNLDHLQALEHEAKLILALASLRRCSQAGHRENDSWGEYRQLFPFLPPGTTLTQVEALLAAVSAENRLREEHSQHLGQALNFCGFCIEHRLEPFERTALLLLLMNFTAPGFATPSASASSKRAAAAAVWRSAASWASSATPSGSSWRHAAISALPAPL